MKSIFIPTFLAIGLTACTTPPEEPSMTFEEAEKYCASRHLTTPRSETRVGLGIGIDGSGKVRPRAGLGISVDVTPATTKQKNYESCVLRKSGTPVAS